MVNPNSKLKSWEDRKHPKVTSLGLSWKSAFIMVLTALEFLINYIVRVYLLLNYDKKKIVKDGRIELGFIEDSEIF